MAGLRLKFLLAPVMTSPPCLLLLTEPQSMEHSDILCGKMDLQAASWGPRNYLKLDSGNAEEMTGFLSDFRTKVSFTTTGDE